MKTDIILFKLTRIQTEQFATIPKVNLEDEIGISAGIEFSMEKETPTILCTVAFNFISDEQNFIILHVRCEFSVVKKAWESNYQKEDKKFIFPAKFMQHLGVITVGTARGILHAKTEGTEFNRFFLPPVNLKDMVPTEVSFPAE